MQTLKKAFCEFGNISEINVNRVNVSCMYSKSQ